MINDKLKDMKKIIFSFIAVLALGCGFTSCGSDDDEKITYDQPAQVAAVGTYTGTWTRSLKGGEENETFSGTVTIAATDQTGVIDITFSSPDASLDKTSRANVWNSGYEFQFMNQTDGNGLGAAFSGRIDAEGSLTTSFTINQKVGRKAYDYNYSFIGKK
jgi:hypothetical protein